MANPFTLFNLPVSFELDLQQLSERYLSLQKELHPDNFVTADSAMQRLAMQQATELNDAFKTLKNPILRAEMIIALHTEKQDNLEQKSTQDIAFLMQQLQWREELERIEHSKDNAQLAQFAQHTEQKTQQILTALSASLQHQQWQESSQYCDQLRFMQKLAEQIEQVEERFFEC